MTLLYTDQRFLDHDTRRGHPERAERLRRIAAHLDATGLAARCGRPGWEPARREAIERVHEPHYIHAVADLASRGGGRPEPDTVVSAASYEVARLAAGAAVDAVGRVIAGDDRTALCLVRPPGHHALPDRAMGFCLFNNVAVAARAALDQHHLERVMIVDWDVHHGNGTQDIFYTDGRVGFLSIHRWPFYPGTGAADESGSGAGLGTTLNLPIEFGTPRARYREAFRSAVERFASQIRPQLVLVSAGFDAHREDPIGSLGLETEDFAALTRDVLDVAAVHAGGRVVSLLEGGYNVERLAECVGTHLEEILSTP